MKDSNSFVYNVWLIILLVAAYIWPIFGLVPAIYLFIKRKDEQLEKMQGWITLAPNDHFLNLLCSSCWLGWQVKIDKLKPLVTGLAVFC